jgi:hypothetical protein
MDKVVGLPQGVRIISQAWSKMGYLAKELSGLPSGLFMDWVLPNSTRFTSSQVPTHSGYDDFASHSALFAQINGSRGEHHIVLKHVI